MQKKINIVESSRAQLNWPIIKIPANNLHVVMNSRGMPPYDAPYLEYYELKPAEVNFSPARIETGGVTYSATGGVSDPERITCYQFNAKYFDNYGNFRRFCQSDKDIKQVEGGSSFSLEGTESWVMLVSTSKLIDGTEPASNIIPWAKCLGAEFVDPRTREPVIVNVVPYNIRSR